MNGLKFSCLTMAIPVVGLMTASRGVAPTAPVPIGYCVGLKNLAVASSADVAADAPRTIALLRAAFAGPE